MGGVEGGRVVSPGFIPASSTTPLTPMMKDREEIRVVRLVHKPSSSTTSGAR